MFHNIYSLSKTLRFELKPLAVNDKEELIENKKIMEPFVSADEKKATAYKEVKGYLDKLHQEFICKTFTNFEIPSEELEAAYKAFCSSSHNDNKKEIFEKITEKLRKQIKKHLNKNEEKKDLFGKKVIVLLKNKFQSNEKAMKMISEFDKFTIYFGGYNQSRKNIYDQKIPERLINDNLPKHYKNVKDYQKIRELLSNELRQLSQDFGINTDVLFSVNYFNKIMTQTEINKYNEIIGGRSEKEGQKTKELNEYINEYNSIHKKEKISLQKFQQLYKQILSEVESKSFRYSELKDIDELTKEIDTYYEELNQKVLKPKTLVKLLEDLASENYELDNIYISMPYINSISSRVFDRWDYIATEIKNAFSDSKDKSIKKTIKALESEDNDSKNKKFISFGLLRQALLKDDKDRFAKLMKYFAEMKADQKISQKRNLNLFENINEAHEKYLGNKKDISNIKVLLDAIKGLQEFIRVFAFNEAIDTDAAFYNVLNEQYAVLRKIISLYNRARNLATKKPYSLEKFKLNFDCPTLLAGWDVNKEQDNLSILLKKDGLYYLGIISSNSKHKKDVFEKLNQELSENTKECYEKIEYKLLPGANKMLPKVFFSQKGIEEFYPSADLLEKYEKGYHKKGESFDINFCHELIDFFKSAISKHEDWSKFDFHFSPTESYEDMSGFYREVEEQGYKITFRNIAATNIYDLVKTGKLYLFKIHNKDFSEYSHGTPNLHTIYWRALFDEDNLKNVVYKLNGEAEMFFRKRSIDENKIIKHKANEPIPQRRNENKSSIFAFDLIKDKRFTVDKFQFHVPITLNFKAQGKDNINDLVREYIKNSDDISIIGIDRGERNLLYYSLIDPKGNIKEQGSLNIIKEKFQTNYHHLLGEKEVDRKKAREEWQEIEKIKDLKTGYLSQAIHKITELMIKNKAIVVLENLNGGFKRSRIKIEKRIYQNFEKMLIEKLNYLVIKNKEEKTEEGGILNAYQLTSKFVSFKKLGIQSGFLFYISPWNTSNIDPTTGFVNLFQTKYQNIEKTKQFISKFKDIRYNEKEGYFEFEVDDYEKFTDKATGNKKDWIICTYGDKIIHERINGKWNTKNCDITNEFHKLLKDNNVSLDNIKEDCASITDANFFRKFLKLFEYTVQLRNSDKTEERNLTRSIDTDNYKDIVKKERKKDYILSPVKNKNGEFFDSRKNFHSLPIDADANGAYNIARKGLMVIEQIKRDEKIKISNEDWLNFAQKNC